MTTQLLRKLRALRRRLLWVALCRKFFVAVKWMAFALLPMLIVGRLIPCPIAFEQIALGVATLGLLFVVAWAISRPICLFEAAVRTDEALGLRERLSTALAIAHPVTEPEVAVLRDAVEHASAIQPRSVFRFDAQKDMRRAAIPMLALCLVWWLLPQFDLLKTLASKKAASASAVAVETRKEAAKKLEDLADKINQTAELRKPAIAEDMQKSLNALAKKLEDQKIEPEKAMASVAQLQDRIAARKMEIEKNLAMANDMQTKGLGKHTQDIAEAMKKGNFAQAARMMDELKKNLQSNSLSEQEKAAIQKELKALSGQLGPDTPAGKALAKACEKMSEGQFNSALANLEEGSGALLDMEGMLQELKALDSLQYDMDARKLALCGKGALCEGCKDGKACLGGNCPGKEGVGEWKAGDNRKQGNGMGGPGIGRGGVARSAPNNVAFKPTRIQGNIAPGEIVAKMKIPGSQTPGEASVAYEQMREMAKQQAEDTIQNDVMPLEHRALIRDYFAAIKESAAEQKK